MINQLDTCIMNNVSVYYIDGCQVQDHSYKLHSTHDYDSSGFNCVVKHLQMVPLKPDCN